MSSKRILLKLKRLLEELEDSQLPEELIVLNGKLEPVLEKDSHALEKLLEKKKE
jgi:hypothetical protein